MMIGSVTCAIAAVAALFNAGCSGSRSEGDSTVVPRADQSELIATTDAQAALPIQSTGQGSPISILTSTDGKDEENVQEKDHNRVKQPSTLFLSDDCLDKCLDVIPKPYVQEQEMRNFQSSMIHQTEDWLFDDTLLNTSPIDAITDNAIDSDVDNWYHKKYVKWLVSSLTMSYASWSGGLDRLPEDGIHVKREWVENSADILAADENLSDREAGIPPPAPDYQVVMPENVIRRVFSYRQLCVEKLLLADGLKNRIWQNIKGDAFLRVPYMRRAGLDVSSMEADLSTYGSNIVKGILDMTARLVTAQLIPNIPLVDQMDRSSLIKLIAGEDASDFDVFGPFSPFYTVAFELVASKPHTDNNGHPKISLMVPNRMLNINELDRYDETGFFKLFAKAVSAYVQEVTEGRLRNPDYFTNALNKNQAVEIFKRLLQVVRQEIENLKDDRVFEDMQIQEIDATTNRSLEYVRNRINQFLRVWP